MLPSQTLLPPLWIYLPYVDERAAGMQRFASQMILALRRSGLSFQLLVGEVHGRPDWLAAVPHRVIFGPRVARTLPRSVLALGRVVWLQTVLPRILARSRGATFVGLASELVPFPSFRQIGVAHDLTDFKNFSERKGLAVLIKNGLWKAGLRRSEAVIAISNATRKDIVDIFDINNSKIHVVYEGFDPQLFTPAKASRSKNASPPYLLYAGTLDPHKNVGFLLEVFVKLRSRADGIRLKLVGRHDDKRVTMLRDTLPFALREEVDFVGFVSDETLATMMRECAAFVFPSRNEGFGLAPVEAMACGAPVLASASGSLPEVIGDGGVLLSPDDTQAWVDELTALLTLPEHREQLSKRALARSKAFSWDEAAEAFRLLLNPPVRAAASHNHESIEARDGT